MLHTASHFSELIGAICAAMIQGKHKSSKTHLNITADVSYDDYILISRSNGWEPADPIEKLEDTISRFNDAYDVTRAEPPEAFGRYISMLETEIGFLLQLLGRASDRRIDLTRALGLAVNMVQKIAYQLMKRSLQQQTLSQKHRTHEKLPIVTLISMTHDIQHWMYRPVREILSLLSRRLPHVAVGEQRRGFIVLNATID